METNYTGILTDLNLNFNEAREIFGILAQGLVHGGEKKKRLYTSNRHFVAW